MGRPATVKSPKKPLLGPNHCQTRTLNLFGPLILPKDTPAPSSLVPRFLPLRLKTKSPRSLELLTEKLGNKSGIMIGQARCEFHFTLRRMAHGFALLLPLTVKLSSSEECVISSLRSMSKLEKKNGAATTHPRKRLHSLHSDLFPRLYSIMTTSMCRLAPLCVKSKRAMERPSGNLLLTSEPCSAALFPLPFAPPFKGLIKSLCKPGAPSAGFFLQMGKRFGPHP